MDTMRRNSTHPYDTPAPKSNVPFIHSFRMHYSTSIAPHPSFIYTMATAAPATAMTMPATLPIMVAAALVLELAAAAAVLELVRVPDVWEGPASVAEASSLLLGLEADVSSALEDSCEWDGLALVAVVLGLSWEAVRQYESTCCWTEGARMSLGQLL